MNSRIESFRIIRLVIILTFCFGIFTQSGNVTYAKDEVIKWRCQTGLPTASPSWAGSVLVVTEKVKRQTDGKFIIEPYPAGSLVPAKEIFNATKRGMVQVGWAAMGYFRNQIPLAGICSGLPLASKELWDAIHFVKFKGFEKMMKDACLKYGLYYYPDKVNPQELVLKKPIRSYEDFKGLKLRSYGVLQVFLTSIGAAAAYLPGPEIYPALASGVVDGAHWGAAQGAYKMGFYDVCKYHLKPALSISAIDGWIINKKAFDNLPKKFQVIFDKILTEHFFLWSNQYYYGEKTTLARVQKEKGVTVLTLPLEDQKKMTQAAMKIWEKEAKKDPEYAKAIDMAKEFQKELGYF